mgnify:CR=1 FL=1|tara:strand:+ start:124 stop:831 length:708 start_codon:yes stop_codon:yes gene_type:complete
MINVDTVYQRVLALANKEQRGYITPQEFNLFANQAQMETFEQYFYDLNQFNRLPGNSTEYSDMVDLLDEKIALFKKQKVLNVLNSAAQMYNIPSDCYRLGTLSYGGSEIEEIDAKELLYIALSPLAQPTVSRPIYTRYENSTGTDMIEVFPKTLPNTNVVATYVKEPEKVYWGYRVIGSNALHDSSTSQHFELHRSEESALVIKILAYAGITLNKPGLVQIGTQLDQAKVQQEKQ